MPYKCTECGWTGEESELTDVRIDLEEYYGVGADFGGHHHVTVPACPDCGDTEHLVEFEDEEEEDA